MVYSGDWRGASWRRRATLAVALLGTACASSACDEAGEGVVHTAGPICSARVIVRFATEPSEASLAALERASTLELAPLGAITADTRVYLLRTQGFDADCRAAIERLRKDVRVRSVDLDARRAPHDGQPTSREAL